MNSRSQAKSYHWDVAAALIVIAAAMFFLPPLRRMLLWPELALVGVFAVLVVIEIFRQKAAPVTYQFSPPTGAQALPGATELVRKSLADKINNLDWLPFEQLLTGIYASLGYSVKRASGPHADAGVDLLLQKNKTKTLVQCKHWKATEVDEKELKEFVGTLTREKIETGIFATAREFTFGARRFAAMNNLLLAGSRDLVRMLEEAGGQNNPVLRAALEQSRKFCPRCEKDMVLKNAETGPNPGSRVWVCLGQPKCNYTVNV